MNHSKINSMNTSSSKPQLRPGSLRNLLRMSDRKRLLVEGPDDVIAFKILLKTLYGNHDVSVHSAETIKLEDVEEFSDTHEMEAGFGNRQKVKKMCKIVNSLNINNESYKGQLVGFIDREYDGFDLLNGIADNIRGHKVLQDIKLIWSRGHSLENYYFDFIIILEAFDGYSEFFDIALPLFERHFEDTIRLACAAALAGKTVNRFEVIRRTIDWEILRITDTRLELDTDIWKHSLESFKGIDSSMVYSIIAAFEEWQTKIASCNFQTLRWLCHGHVGFTFMIELYTRCVFEACADMKEEDQKNAVNRVRSFGSNAKQNDCLKSWSRNSKNDAVSYPKEVFQMLNVE